MAWTIRTPVDRLPVELLSYILVLGTHSSPSISDDSQESTSFNVDSVKIPLVFTAVNRHWRTIALNTPALWTSLCVTVGSLEGVSDADDYRSVLNTSHVTSYLSLSRKYPLDILIDARDMEWDFCEPEYALGTPFRLTCNTHLYFRIPNFDDYTGDYTPPFSPQTMSVVIALLLPHISRWRSIDILTDTWAPMYAALNMLNESLTTLGAPLLESLTLMRCNDYISHSPQFQPRHMRHPLFLKPRSSPNRPLSPGLLPRLRTLTLRGVHVCWSSVPTLVCTESISPLLCLELSSHSLDVRPSLQEFSSILSSCPLLRKLVVNGSGFAFDESKVKQLPVGRRSSLIDSEAPILLPHLQELNLGYRSTLDGRKILGLFRAPNVTRLTLEDASHPGDLEEPDVTNILRYIATGDGEDVLRSYPTNSSLPTAHNGDGIVQSSYRAPAPTSESGPSSVTDPYRQRRATIFTSQPFPFLEALTLKGVKTDPTLLKPFLLSLSNLKYLTLSSMVSPMHALHALLPATRRLGSASGFFGHIVPRGLGTQLWASGLISPSPSSLNTMPIFINPFSGSIISSPLSTNTPPCSQVPCGKLERLSIRGSRLSVIDIEVIIMNLVVERERGGWPHLRNIDIHLDDTSDTNIANVLSHMNIDPASLTRPFSHEADTVVFQVSTESERLELDEIEVKIIEPRTFFLSDDDES
ncbi:hypothetical protein PM082_008244 [Marasmius tenuissimus]|nr:hypothetical protein PM082_008244 [Marasmius tenuissimus]